MSDADRRRLRHFKDLLQEFHRGSIGFDQLTNKLEGLLEGFDGAESNLVKSLHTAWENLEVALAVALDRGIELPSIRDESVATTISHMNSLIDTSDIDLAND